MTPIEIPEEVQRLLDLQAPVVIGVSGGKDSMAVALAVSAALEDYAGPKLLLHADLGSVEWADSWPACERTAEATGWELASCTRPAGGMMSRWQSRWASSVRRYLELSCVKVILPWSTPSMRFCQSELKVDPITAYIKKRYGQVPVLNVTGIRAEESASRAKQPVCSPVAKLPPGSLAWRPIHHWLLADVWQAIAESGADPHEAYGTYGSTRVSCRYCILASEHDLVASLKDPAGRPVYVEMCDLELTSGFSFQGNRWLTGLAPELVPDGGARLLTAMQLAARRTELEAWIPKHLTFTKGWPHCVPSQYEAIQLADTRKRMADLYGWDHSELVGSCAWKLIERYEQLMELKYSKK